MTPVAGRYPAQFVISMIMEAKPTQYAMIMEAKPTQYAMTFEAEQSIQSFEAKIQSIQSFEAEENEDLSGPVTERRIRHNACLLWRRDIPAYVQR